MVDSARREDSALEGMITAAEEIAQELAERTPLIGTIVGIDDDESAVIDLGGKLGIEEDDDLVIFRYGKEYYSPETGAYLGQEREVIGEGEVEIILGPELSRIDYDLEGGELRVGDKVILEESDKHWQLFDLNVEMIAIGIELKEQGSNLILSASGLTPAFADHTLALNGVASEYSWRMSTGGTLKMEFPLESLRLGAGMGAMVQYLSTKDSSSVVDIAFHLVGTLGWNFVEGKVMKVGVRLMAGGAYHLPIFSSGLFSDVTVEGSLGYYLAASFPIIELRLIPMIGLEFGAGVVYAPYEFTAGDSGTEYHFTAGPAYGLHIAGNIYL
ncbi:hypothetical protein K8R78_01445 [bacterium]|nr:hypothetical protein [bacterium]